MIVKLVKVGDFEMMYTAFTRRLAAKIHSGGLV